MFHRKAHKVVNAVIALCLVGVFLIFVNGPTPSREDISFPSFDEAKWREIDKDNSSTIIDSSAEDLAQWNLKGLNLSASISGKEVVNSVNYLNTMYDILNVDQFGPVENVKTVIVIQVHNRVSYLGYLIESLRNTKGIEDTLLVFSHDINVAAVNHLVRNITFARVYQIFYPLNMQLFPHIFPGQDPRDCPEKIGKKGAAKLNCQNKDHPDKYGNYRVAKLTQIKHHWWWKMNFVFDGLIEKFNLHESWVLLLEEDHFVVPDALHVLDYITTNRITLCPACELISLGFYLKSTKKYGTNINHLGAHPWFSSKHNMGLALRKDDWAKIKNCSELFCTWDDYNWDWSVMQISAKCLPQRFRVIFAKSPRVLHIGDCGVHTHRCTAHNAYAAARTLIDQHKGLLFSEQFAVTDVSRRSLKPSKENGGWGDQRDHALCRLNTHPLSWGTSNGADMGVLDGLLRSTASVPKSIGSGAGSPQPSGLTGL